MNIEIIQKKDYNIIAKLNKDVQDLHCDMHPDIFKSYDYETMYKGFSEYISQENFHSFIAYYEEEPVGYILVCIRDYKETPFKAGYKSLYIDQICIKKEYRHKGTGHKLIEYVKNFAKEQGINRIELTVWTTNNNAKSFFRKAGFEPYMENMYMELPIKSSENRKL